ncbi:MAG: aminopeptidase [Wujia sp.]
MEYREDDLYERMELAIGRIDSMAMDELPSENQYIKDYFDRLADFILYVYDVFSTKGQPKGLDTLVNINRRLYEDILPEHYENSYANPDYAVKRLGKECGQLLCALYAEMRSIIVYAYEDSIEKMVSLMELFLEVYGMFLLGDDQVEQYIREAIYYYMYDYADVLVADRIVETISSEDTFATDIIMKSDLNTPDYLYSYGEYIGKNELETSAYLAKLPEDKVKAMAATYVQGYIKGFEVMRIDLKPKKTVNIRYSIGQERMIRYAIDMFEDKGLKPIIFRYAVSRNNRKLNIRTGYVGTPANKQYEYDHRMDEAIFFDRAYMERKLSVIADTYEKHKELAAEYAGPAVVEVFGELPFKPEVKENAIRLSKKQQDLSVEYSSKSAEITNRYIKRDKYSFTIIAYPIPEIGEKFEEIYDEIVRVNTLDNDKYRDIQQCIIDALDDATYVHVIGCNGNKTDIRVMLHDIDREKETNFENCLADVNIPLGEVFTSPVLTGTNGILNVSRVYLNELRYTDLTIRFEDGKMVDYTCSNFESEEKNKAFIRENLMFNHDTLPIGEFAIGTNTTAYVMANKYDILYKLPILIVEKMGPHFAVGDTCYSYSEDNRLYNPDGREIVAKENECSLLRKSGSKEDMAKAYFNCHTDITIPYEEIGGIYAVKPDGTRTAIIEEGRFVLAGTEQLNEPFDE